MPQNVNAILNVTQQLTYRQFILLALISENKNNEMHLRTEDYREEGIVYNSQTHYLLQDFIQLHSFGDNSKKR